MPCRLPTIQGNMNRTTYLMGDSRVRKLTPNNLPIAKTWTRPGTKIYDLYEVVDGELSELTDNAIDPPLVLVSAGICDLTIKQKSRIQGGQHEEVTVIPAEQNEELINNTCEALDDLQRFIARQGAIPILSTIYPMGLLDWNATRLNRGKTSVLYKADQYPSMQANLEYLTEEVNNKIVEININNNVKTPLIHKCLRHNRGGGRKVSYRYNLLEDGCHPSNSLVNDIVKTLSRNIQLNRMNLNQD